MNDSIERVAAAERFNVARAKVAKRQEQLRIAVEAREAAEKAYREANTPPIPAEPGTGTGVFQNRNISYSSLGMAVITFTKTFNAAGIYHYAAIRPAGSSFWVITTASSTQTHGRKYIWAELMAFVAEKEPLQGRTALASVAEWVKK